ncbi:hypothetical protein D3C77_341940 [compost metagenome]
MGHLGEISDNRLPGNIPPEGDGQLRFGILEHRCLHHFPHRHQGDLIIRHLDSDCGFAGNRRFHTNILSGERQSDIIRQIHNPAHLHPDIRLNFVPRYGRASNDLQHARSYSKALERCLEFAGRLFIIRLIPSLAATGRLRKQTEWRQLIWFRSRLRRRCCFLKFIL